MVRAIGRAGWMVLVLMSLVGAPLTAENPLRQLSLEQCQTLLARAAQHTAGAAADATPAAFRHRLLERYRDDPFALEIAAKVEKMTQFDFEDQANLFSGNVWFRMVAPVNPGEPHHLVIGIPLIAKIDPKTGKPIDPGTLTAPSATSIKFMAGVMMGIERIEQNQQSLDPSKRRNRFKVFQDVTVIAQSVVNRNLARDLTRLGFAHPDMGRLTDDDIRRVIGTAPPPTDPEDPETFVVEEGKNALSLALTVPLRTRSP